MSLALRWGLYGAVLRLNPLFGTGMDLDPKDDARSYSP
jgi:hypothetical protein